MLIVLIQNDGKGDRNVANYDVEVRVNERVIHSTHIDKHRRGDGWRTLLRRVADSPGPKQGNQNG